MISARAAPGLYHADDRNRARIGGGAIARATLVLPTPAALMPVPRPAMKPLPGACEPNGDDFQPRRAAGLDGMRHSMPSVPVVRAW